MRILNQSGLGQRLKLVRKKLGYTQDFEAKELGVLRQAIIAIESGKRKVASIELFKLADLYGITVEELISKPQQLPQSNLEAYFPIMKKQGKINEKDIKTLIQFIKICEDYDSLNQMIKENNA